jgi:hypothetical protein
MSYHYEDFRSIANQLHYEEVPCETCYGAKHLWGRMNAQTSTARDPKQCDHCEGTGRLWAPIPLERGIPRPFNVAKNDTQFIALAKEKGIIA